MTLLAGPDIIFTADHVIEIIELHRHFSLEHTIIRKIVKSIIAKFLSYDAAKIENDFVSVREAGASAGTTTTTSTSMVRSSSLSVLSNSSSTTTGTTAFKTGLHGLSLADIRAALDEWSFMTVNRQHYDDRGK